MSMPLFARSGLVAMVTMSFLAGAQASIRGSSLKRNAIQPMQLSTEEHKYGHYGCADACNHDSACTSSCESEYYKCGHESRAWESDDACQEKVLKKYGASSSEAKQNTVADRMRERLPDKIESPLAQKEETEAKAEGEAEGELSGEEAEKRKAGETWAISFFATICLLAVVFAMASTSNSVVRNYTWFLIDQVIAIFLAVMYFQAFDSILDFHAMGLHGEVLSSIVHAVMLLFMVLAVAYYFRENKAGLAILCGAGAHMVSFSSIHAAAGLQNHWIEGFSLTMGTCILGMGVLAIGLAIIGCLVYTGKKHAKLVEDDEFMDKTDDLENDFGAMAFSVVFTMFMRYVITGHHPEDDETEFEHTATERNYMLMYAFACLVTAVFVVSFASKQAADSTSYVNTRICNFVKTVAAMNVAWAFLYWGEWEFFGVLFAGEAIKGRVMFAIVTTVVGGLGIVLLSMRHSPEGNATNFKSEQMVALTALSLVVAWSWELCFDAAMEDMSEGAAHPAKLKILSALALFGIVVPVYAIYVKPITGPAAEAIGA